MQSMGLQRVSHKFFLATRTVVATIHSCSRRPQQCMGLQRVSPKISLTADTGWGGRISITTKSPEGWPEGMPNRPHTRAPSRVWLLPVAPG